MKHGHRLRSWFIGIGLGLCLIVATFIGLRQDISGIWDPVPQSPSTASTPQASPAPTTFRHKKKLHHRTSAHAIASENKVANLTAERNAEAGIPTASIPVGTQYEPTEPQRRILKPLGFVQKANGLVEAIVSEDEGVQVVHIGDAYEEKYKVTQISPNGVEIVLSGSTMAEPQPTETQAVSVANQVNGLDSGSWSYAPSRVVTARTSKHNDLAPSITTEAVKVKQVTGNSAAGLGSQRQSGDTSTVASTSPSMETGPLGFVEKRDGTKVSIVSDGDWVRLQPQESKPIEVASNVTQPGATGKSHGEDVASKEMGEPNSASHVGAKMRSPLQPAAASTLPLSSNPGLGPIRGSYDAIVNPDSGKAVGFVEKVKGVFEAILDEGDEIKLAKASDSPPEILNAENRSTVPTELAISAPTIKSNSFESWARLAPEVGAPLLEGQKDSRNIDSYNATANGFDKGNQSNTSGLPIPSNSAETTPPDVDSAKAESLEVADRPLGYEVAVESSPTFRPQATDYSVLTEDMLSDLGLLNDTKARASPITRSYEPAAPPTGPPSASGIATSSGYGDWKFGRASPISNLLALKIGDGGSAEQGTILLKTIGFLQWPDGRSFAVIDDGDGGVSLVHEGQVIGNRFRVLRINPPKVEVIDLSSNSPLSGIHRPQQTRVKTSEGELASAGASQKVRIQSGSNLEPASLSSTSNAAPSRFPDHGHGISLGASSCLTSSAPPNCAATMKGSQSLSHP